MQQTRAFPPLVEAFVVLEQPRQRVSHWTKALAPLDDERAPPLATVNAYYDAATDQALIGLRYDEVALGTERLAFVIETALLAEVALIQPAEMSEGDRRRFTERLAHCSIHIANQRNVVNAISELVKRVRESRETRRESAPLPFRLPATPPPIPAARATTSPRGDTPNPMPALPKSTRDNVPRATSPNIVRGQRTSIELPPPSADPNDNSLRIALPASTVSADASPGRAGSPADDVHPNSAPLPPGIIYARYLRSGKWVPIRIGALSLKGAALMSGALPRLHDRVDVALTFAGHRALVRGPVNKVSSQQEAALSGAATFSVKFELDDAARRQLTTLLTAARAANITIKPPPARSTRRYPVEWPVCLGTMRGAVRADALDVSLDGMFVRPVHALTLDTNLNFSAVLDDGAAPVSGRAKVVRHVTEAEARAGGLSPGYGLQIVDMAHDADRERWYAFLVRVERRAEKRILIGAAPGRLAEIQTVLAAAGYAVTGGTDPGAIVQLASAETRPVDAALLDGGWLTSGSSTTWVESLFSARSVPYVTMHGDARRARGTVDKLLAVV